MSELVKTVAHVIVESMGDTPESAARAALLWLADNVSDEMVIAMHDGPLGARGEEITATQRQWLVDMASAALRAAAGDGK